MENQRSKHLSGESNTRQVEFSSAAMNATKKGFSKLVDPRDIYEMTATAHDAYERAFSSDSGDIQEAAVKSEVTPKTPRKSPSSA